MKKSKYPTLPRIPVPTFPLGRVIGYYNSDKIVLDNAKKNKDTIYGSQALKKHIGFLARKPNDYDILSKSPRKRAMEVEKELDKQSGGDYYYYAPAIHKGTWKVKEIGPDNKMNTADDINIVDYSEFGDRNPKEYVTKDEQRFVPIKSIIRDRYKAIRDPEYKFRWEKDRDDLKRIRLFRSIKKINNRFRRR